MISYKGYFEYGSNMIFIISICIFQSHIWFGKENSYWYPQPMRVHIRIGLDISVSICTPNCATKSWASSVLHGILMVQLLCDGRAMHAGRGSITSWTTKLNFSYSSSSIESISNNVLKSDFSTRAVRERIMLKRFKR